MEYYSNINFVLWHYTLSSPPGGVLSFGSFHFGDLPSPFHGGVPHSKNKTDLSFAFHSVEALCSKGSVLTPFLTGFHIIKGR